MFCSTSRGTGLRVAPPLRWAAGRRAAPPAGRWLWAGPAAAPAGWRWSGRWTRSSGGRDTSRSGCCRWCLWCSACASWGNDQPVTRLHKSAQCHISRKSLNKWLQTNTSSHTRTEVTTWRSDQDFDLFRFHFQCPHHHCASRTLSLSLIGCCFSSLALRTGWVYVWK